MPLKLTLVAPVKSVPVRVTTVPTGPLVGFRLVRVGAGVAPPAASEKSLLEMSKKMLPLARTWMRPWVVAVAMLGMAMASVPSLAVAVARV